MSETRWNPWLFQTPMVAAILAGEKGQTRRLIARVRGCGQVTDVAPAGPDSALWRFTDAGERRHMIDYGELVDRCPYGQVHDHAWVRETWAVHPRFNGWTCRDFPDHGADLQEMLRTVVFKTEHPKRPPWDDTKWRPAIHLQRLASRIDLQITGVRVERLHDITEHDARAEGVKPIVGAPDGWEYRAAYQRLWGEINGPGAWDANPFVWVLSFRRIRP